ncbi:hypothetical protein EJ06DRAFT_585830 [Trichodelitschia bisporula]|uniref:Uncharacterized protein n=1 Tax=Trichodelitschia bisporula TaxID=703511 RepID=A0A6G1HIH6_9PEZI|nr:hypothetical protein EJ06DRAFT_585830 [Trichodelitschia bisporula]
MPFGIHLKFGRRLSTSPITAQTDAAHRDRWHRAVQDFRSVTSYLAGGKPLDPQRLEPLKRPTKTYLDWLQRSVFLYPAQQDDHLLALVEEHASVYAGARDAALLACLHHLSSNAAINNLALLSSSEPTRYLRCVVLAAALKPGVISAGGLGATRALLRISSSAGVDSELPAVFRELVQCIAQGNPDAALPLDLISVVLARSELPTRLQTQVAEYIRWGKFLSLFHMVSWLQGARRLANAERVMPLLDDSLPLWPALSVWRPDVHRLAVWESGTFADIQRLKLMPYFELDGPDTATKAKESLRLSEPACYAHVSVEIRSPRGLERVLEVLHRAYGVGPGALELFIYQCVDFAANEARLGMVHAVIQQCDDKLCKDLLQLFAALDTDGYLIQQMVALTQALSALRDGNMPQSAAFPADQIAARLAYIVRLATREFQTQSRTGTGEYLGMRIFHLCQAAVSVPWVAPYLPAELRTHIATFPPQHSLETIFDHLQSEAHSVSTSNSRFKAYVSTLLGGAPPTSPPTNLSTLTRELAFWAAPPDFARSDFARSLARISTLPYEVYTTLLHATLVEENLYIAELTAITAQPPSAAVPTLAAYLIHRRRLSQLQDVCWLLLLVHFSQVPEADFPPCLVGTENLAAVLAVLTPLLLRVADSLPPSGPGLTLVRVKLWERLAQRIVFGGTENPLWMFLVPDADVKVMGAVIEALDPGQDPVEVSMDDPADIVIFDQVIKTQEEEKEKPMPMPYEVSGAPPIKYMGSGPPKPPPGSQPKPPQKPKPEAETDGLPPPPRGHEYWDPAAA